MSSSWDSSQRTALSIATLGSVAVRGLESDAPGAAKYDVQISTDVPVRPEQVTGEMLVTKILVHPIKSCRGTAVNEAKYTPTGLEWDRRWCIVEEPTHKVITARQVPKMVLITPTLLPDPASPTGGVLRVSFPVDSGCAPFEIPLHPSEADLATYDRITDLSIWSWSGVDAYVVPHDITASLSAFIGKPVRLALKAPIPRVCNPTHAHPELGSEEWPADILFQDGYPLLIASEESAKEIEERVRAMVGVQGVKEQWKDATLVMERFRPNIVFGGAGVPFAEDAFVDVIVAPRGANTTSTPTISCVSKCTRCLFPNIDPTTGIRDAAVPFKPLMKTRKGLAPEAPQSACFGVNAVPRGSGVVKVGDVVNVTKWVET